MKKILIVLMLFSMALSNALVADAKKTQPSKLDKIAAEEAAKAYRVIKQYEGTSWFNPPTTEQTEQDKLNSLIKNPSSQSADMQSYIAFYNAGNEAANEGNHENALSFYNECRKLIARTSDSDLKNIYNNYGWKKELDDSYTKSYTQFKLKNPGKAVPGEQVEVSQSAPSSSGGYSAPYTPTQHPNYCSICSRTGKCSTCNGSGISPYSKSICGACGGYGRCTACGGTGISGYSTY